MKKTLVFSGLIALGVSLLTMVVFTSVVEQDPNEVFITHKSNLKASPVVYTVDESGNSVELNFTQTAEAVLDGVVHIKSTQVVSSRGGSPFDDMPDMFRDFFGEGFAPPRGDQPRVGTGSGVIISEDGYIVTNNHVIANADEIEISLQDNRIYTAKVIGADPSTDLALLKIEESNLPVVALTDSDQVDVGQWVLAVGNPMGLNSTVTAGIISAKGRNINILKDRYAVENFIQTDAAINPGNSGGALVNLSGDLVGINTAIASTTGSFSGYGFAIPANIVSKVITDLKEYGIVQRGVLGVFIRSIDGNLAKEKDLNYTQGVYVDSLIASSAAEEAGVEPGDVILEVEGVPVKSSPELQGMIARFRPGQTVNILVDRSGKTRTIPVVLNNASGNKDLATKMDKDLENLLGADFRALSEEEAEALGLDGGVEVVRLYSGKLAKYTQMKEGFVITKINDQKVRKPSDMKSLLDDLEGGVMLEGRYPDMSGNYYYAFGM